ncbi:MULTISPECIES: non-ribosomal peptide synthetase [Bacillus cereus group]|uniref:non-ribosomal peptide synthetase n=1 Tax=Bacillus cereus group TaxID=86661 RepID=UPI000BF33EA7|nr:non-ribosomal peptide synthetase [Bacillus thuringiensis]PEV20661.1 hypothetical protein CN420_25755 [Bacillus thuringiensis]PFS68920.1 hypothetical protein COK50_26360 [Bacillus thuringiensis]
MSIDLKTKVEQYEQIRIFLAEKLSINVSEVPDELVDQTYEALLLEKEAASNEQTVLEKLESHCVTSPNEEAILCGKISITFNRIVQGMNCVAKSLLSKGVKHGMRIGVHVENPIDRIYAILGGMRAGAVVMVLDPLETIMQKRKQLESANVTHLICESELVNQIEVDLSKTVLIEKLEDLIDIELPKPPLGKDNAYLSVTSGKEVIWTHSELLDRTASLQIAFDMKNGETFALWQLNSGDAWLYHALWPLTMGAKLLLPKTDESVEELIGCVSDIQANLIYFDSHVIVAIAKSNVRIPDGPRAILCGSEPIYQSVVSQIINQCDTDVFFCFTPGGLPLSFMPVKARENIENERFSLGIPRMGRATLLDSQGETVEEGVVGEIHLWDGIEFVQTGFKAIISSEGDWKWVENQNKHLTIVGQQIYDTKLIAKALMNIPEVSDAIVMLKTNEFGCSEPVVFVVLTDERISSWDLYEKLQGDVPREQLGFKIAKVNSIPLKNGHIDEEALLKIPVVSSSQIKKIKGKVCLLPGVSSAETVAVPNSIDMGRLHLYDILSNDSFTKGYKSFDREAVTVEERAEINTIQEKVLSPSYIKGEELVVPVELPNNLSTALQETASLHPNNGIYFIDSDGMEVFVSYPDLLKNAKRILGGLQSYGVKPGARVILQVDSLKEHFSAFWACVMGGITPATVAIAPSYQEENGVVAKIYHTWNVLEKPLIITTNRLRASMKQMTNLYSMAGLEILTIEELEGRQVDGKIYDVKPGDLAFFQLTSGSTGAPKCIQEVHEKIIRHIHAAKQNNSYCAEDITLNWLQLDHVVPILTCHLKDVYLGCSQVQAQTDYILEDPLRWLDLIQKYKVSHSWSPNFGFKLISESLKNSEGENWDLSSLKYLMNAGEQVTLPVVSEFLDLTREYGVSEKVMQPAFGMAEVCTCMTYCNDFSRNIHGVHVRKSSLHTGIEVVSESQMTDAVSFVSSGRPVNGIEIRIVDGHNSILPEGVIGRFQIRGGVVMPGYLNNTKANEESFVGDDWFNTGDLGFIKNGELFITGREKELIIINGANFYCHEIEEMAGQVEGVLPTFVAACGIQDSNAATESLGIFFVAKTKDFSQQIQIAQEIRTNVATKLGISPGFVIPLEKENFLKTTSGKIQRDVMKQSYIKGQYIDIQKRMDLTLGNENTLPNWFFRKTWIKRQLSVGIQKTIDAALIFGSHEGVAGNLASHIRSGGGKAVIVEVGKEFLQLSEDHFIVNPNRQNDFEAVLSKIKVTPTYFVHAWQCDVESNIELGLYSLISLFNAIDKKGISPLNLTLITKYAWGVLETELANPMAAAMTGILKTAEQERIGLQCLHFDFDSLAPALVAKAAYQELMHGDMEKELAFRNGNRMIPKLINAELLKDVSTSPIKREKLYLVTGGTKGIGSLTVKMLIEEFAAKVLIVSRSKVEKDTEFAKYIEKHKKKILFVQADVANLVAIADAVKKAEDYWQEPILGAFHFAGVMEERLIEEESPESIATVIKGKVMGAESLIEIFSSRPDSFLMLSSSVNGYFGGFKAGAYSAANAYLDALPSAIGENGPKIYSISWTQWEEIGMNKDSLLVELSKAKGFMSISASQGMASLLATLCQSSGNMIVGLNPNKHYVASHMILPVRPGDLLQCYYSGEVQPNRILGNLSKYDLTDEFGTVFDFNIIWLEEMPVDAMGAPDKSLLKKLAINKEFTSSKFREPQSNTEKKLADIWKEILNVNKIGVADNFFELGGNSLLATQLVSRIRSHFKIELLIESLFKNATLGALGEEIDSKVAEFTSLESSMPLKRYDQRNLVPLSFAQERLWFLNQLSPGNPFYNIQQMIGIKGLLKWKDVERAFRKVAERQAVLRTTFEVIDESPVQKVNKLNDSKIFDFKFIDLLGYKREEVKSKIHDIAYEESQKGFDLEQGPVFRCRLISIDEKEHILMLTLHHIVADAWSISILIREFLAVFESITLSELPIEYTDFSLWQREWLSGEELDKQLKYWKNNLKGYNGVLEIESDFPRPPLPSYKGEKLRFNIPQIQVQEIEQLCNSLGVTSNMILFSVFNILLMKYSQSDDIVVGMPIANRNRTEIEDLMGFFVNTLAVRTDLSGNPTFDEMVMRVRDSLLGAYTHQDMPFEKLVNELQLERRLDRQPLCQVVFVMQNVPMQEIKIDGLEIEMLDTPHEVSKFDLTLSFNENGKELAGALEYSTDLFQRESMERLISVWNQLLVAVLKNPQQKLSEIIAQVEVGGELINKWNESMSLPGVSDEEFIDTLVKSYPSIVKVEALTPAQRDLYFEYQKSVEGGQYGLTYSIELGAEIDPIRWRDAVKKAVDVTTVLKSRYFSLNGKFYQFVDNSMEFNWGFIEDVGVDDTLSKYTHEPFNLFESSARHVLFKELKSGNYTAILSCHHILLDAYSANLFFKKVVEFYKVGASNPNLQESSVDFYDLVPARNSNFDRPETISFWKDMIQNVQPLLQKPMEGTGEKRKSRFESIRLKAIHTKEIKQYCKKHKVGTAAYFRGLLGVLLDRFYQPENDFVIFDVRGGREKQEFDVIGCLYHVHPVVFKKSYFDQIDIDFNNVLSQLMYQNKQLSAQQYISVFNQRQILGKEGIRFYTNFYNFDEINLDNHKSRLLVNEQYETGEVHFIIEEYANEIEIRLAYDESAWKSSRMLERLENLSNQVISGCENISQLDVVLNDEVKSITEVWNPSFVKEKVNSNLLTLFNKQVEINPDAVAVCYDGVGISYKELNCRTNQLSKYLIKKGVGANCLVGLLLNPSIDTIICIIGILKAGGAYLPIDSQYPSERIKFMLNDAKVKLLITESELKKQIDTPDNLEMILINTEWPKIILESDKNSKVNINSDQLAYVIYTSGSTGTPKGTLMTHANVIRLFNQTEQWFNFNSSDVWTLFHSIAFDFSVWEIWGALLHGGKLIIVDPFVKKSPYDFYKLLLREKVTVLNQTPSAFSQLIQVDSLHPVDSDSNLRYIIFGGEALNYKSLQPWFNQYGFERPQLVNMYGITETTVHVTYKPIKESDLEQESVSNIGVPIPDLQVYILDRYGKFSPVGAVGELYIGGPGLSQGYLNRPELTIERFIKNHIDPSKSEKLYKTGDIGRWLPNGEIEYLGRADQQIKIRGFRLEIGEIENRIRAIKGIDDVAVIARMNKSNETELIAYIVSKNDLSMSNIKEQLKRDLPEYMLPSAFVTLEVLPLTTNGKLDRKVLPEPDGLNRTLNVEFVQPKNEIEELMIKAWQQVLGVYQIGTEDNFYDLGGHSLKLLELQTKLNIILEGKTRPISIIEIFQYPTIRSLSSFLQSNGVSELKDKDIDLSNRRAEKRKQLAKKRRNKRMNN